MPKHVPGVIHGTTIELKEDPGLADGEEIQVSLIPSHASHGPRPSPPAQQSTAAGMLAHLPSDVDEEIEAIIRDRKNGVFRELPR